MTGREENVDRNCEICGGCDWHVVHRGAIRDGAFGSVREDGLVIRCGDCGVDRLAERCCPSSSFYEGDEYRSHLAQSVNAECFFDAHDELQIFTLETLWPRRLRGRTIADVGCAAGSFLDHVAGLAGRLLAIEPSTIYHESLRARGYTVYSYAADAQTSERESVDIAVTLQVIEHTLDPRAFLADIRPLVGSNGLLLVSTPNRNDLLMKLLPDEYPEFFYRTVHRWYFDADSLARCAALAGFIEVERRFVHRYGLSNALAWLRDRRPTGRNRLPGIAVAGDKSWQNYLESSGQSDCLFMIFRPDSMVDGGLTTP